MATPKTPKTPKLKGPALVHTTRDALFDALGTHRTEALAQRPARSSQLAIEAMRAPTFSPHDLSRVLSTAHRLALDGHADHALRIADVARAMPDPQWYQKPQLDLWKAARAAHLAAIYAALGDAARANASLDEALSLAPSWSAPQTGAYPPSLDECDAAGSAALTLLDLGRTDAARAILDNLYASSIEAGIVEAARRGDGARLALLSVTARPGHPSFGERVVGVLLDRGHIALVDAWLGDALASIYTAPANRARWPLSRALVDGPAAYDSASRERLASFASLKPHEVLSILRAVAETLPARAARDADGVTALARDLYDTLSHDAKHLSESPEFWIAACAAREHGVDITALVNAAATVDARAMAMARLLPATAPGDPLRATLVAFAASIDPTTVAVNPGAAQRAALVALLQAGELDAGAPLARVAAKALRSNPTELGELAAAAMIASDLALAWDLVAEATKAKKPQALSSLRWFIAERGSIDLYWTVCQADMPQLWQRDQELARLIERTSDQRS